MAVATSHRCEVIEQRQDICHEVGLTGPLFPGSYPNPWLVCDEIYRVRVLCCSQRHSSLQPSTPKQREPRRAAAATGGTRRGIPPSWRS
eukprot:scaffold135473_cov50-Prasinocladus_malaysianus.AAC.1